MLSMMYRVKCYEYKAMPHPWREMMSTFSRILYNHYVHAVINA